MPSGGVHLAVHLGAAWATAVLRTGSYRLPVLIDGRPRIPSGVFVDPESGALHPGAGGLAAGAQRPDCYLPDPLAQLGTPEPAGLPHVDPVNVVSAVLAYLANHAAAQARAALTALTVAVPPGWGPRRRRRLHDAAVRAGLPAPWQVTQPAALAAAHATATGSWRDEACALVCHADRGSSPTLTVLQLTGSEFRELATHTIAEDLPTVEEVLAERAYLSAAAEPDGWKAIAQPTTLADQQIRWTLLAGVGHAHETLAEQERAPVLLPPPHPPAVLSRDDLTAAVHPLATRLPAGVHAVLTAADVDATALQHVILATDTTLPGLDEALAAATGPTVTTRPNAGYGIADGALTTTDAGSTTAATAAAVRLPRTRLRPADLTAPLIIGACSMALFLQAVNTTDINRIGGTVNYVRADLEQFAVAGTLIALAALAAAHLAPTTWLTTPTTAEHTEPAAGHLLRRAYASGTAVAVTVAVLYGLAATTARGLNETPYLRSTVTGALPLAATGLLIAAVVPRIPATHLTNWLRHTRTAVIPVALATLGIWFIRAALTITTPVNLTGSPALFGTLGAAALGIATALTITKQPLLRTITTLILGVGYAVVYSLAAARIFVIGYICALTWQAAKLATHTIRHAFPALATKLRRLLDNSPPPS